MKDTTAHMPRYWLNRDRVQGAGLKSGATVPVVISVCSPTPERSQLQGAGLKSGATVPVVISVCSPTPERSQLQGAEICSIRPLSILPFCGSAYLRYIPLQPQGSIVDSAIRRNAVGVKPCRRRKIRVK